MCECKKNDKYQVCLYYLYQVYYMYYLYHSHYLCHFYHLYYLIDRKSKKHISLKIATDYNVEEEGKGHRWTSW